MLVKCQNPDCHIQFSKDQTTCPVCRTEQVWSMETDRVEIAEVKNAERGMTLLTILFVAQIVVSLLFLAVWINLGDTIHIVTTLIRTVLSVFLIVKIYYGSDAAGMVGAFLYAIAILLDLPLFVSTGNPFLFALVLYHIFFLYVVRFSPSVSELVRQRNDEERSP